jgi:uncharacterized protein (TIGR02594 family)
MSEPVWITEARRYIGTREIKGMRHEPLIISWWKAIKRGGIRDDETPWCAAFVGACLEAVGLRSSRFESARSYLDWGVSLPGPALGAVVVFQREGGGHVGFVVGEDVHGNLMVLGGNQGDAVTIAPFARARVVGYRWPTAVNPPAGVLPVLASNGQLSRNEA